MSRRAAAPGLRAAFTAPFGPRPSRTYRNRCDVEGCERHVYARGVCKQHYAQVTRTGRANAANEPGNR